MSYFNFSDEDYKIMTKNNWSIKYVERVLQNYASDYGLSLEEVDQIFSFYGVNELFDGIPIACEDMSDMLYGAC